MLNDWITWAFAFFIPVAFLLGRVMENMSRARLVEREQLRIARDALGHIARRHTYDETPDQWAGEALAFMAMIKGET